MVRGLLVIVLAAMAFLSINGWATEATDPCPVILGRMARIRQSGEAYVRKVRDSPFYSGLLIRDVPENDPKRHVGGFVMESVPWYDWVGLLTAPPSWALTRPFLGKAFYLTPLEGTFHNTVRRPFRYLTGKLGATKDLTNWLTIPGLFLGTSGYRVPSKRLPSITGSEPGRFNSRPGRG